MHYYIIYKITNNVNAKQYIGLHKTNNQYDGYLGSGKLLKYAIKKYGKENFTKEILFVFDNEHAMIAKEIELVTEEWCNRQDTYNIMPGGKYGSTKRNGLTFQGHRHSQTTKNKISAASKNRIHSEKTKKKMSQNSFAKRDPEGQRQHASRIGQNVPTAQTKDKISKAVKENYKNNPDKTFGRPKGKSNKIWIFNEELKQSIMHDTDFAIPKGWQKGRRLKF